MKVLSLARISVPVPRYGRVPSPLITPVYVWVPGGTRTTASPLRTTSRFASTAEVMSPSAAKCAAGRNHGCDGSREESRRQDKLPKSLHRSGCFLECW